MVASRRRWKWMVISPDILIELLKPGKHLWEVIQDAVPADGKVAGVIVDRDIMIAVESESFDLVDLGDIPPRFVPRVIEIEVDWC